MAEVSIATTHSATLTALWFVKRNAEEEKNNIYTPRAHIEVKALVNGQNAFGELADALRRAEESVDIICWGFDPSLRLEGLGK